MLGVICPDCRSPPDVRMLLAWIVQCFPPQSKNRSIGSYRLDRKLVFKATDFQIYQAEPFRSRLFYRCGKYSITGFLLSLRGSWFQHQVLRLSFWPTLHGQGLIAPLAVFQSFKFPVTRRLLTRPVPFSAP